MRPVTRYTAPHTLDPAPHWGDDAACRTSLQPDYWFAEGDDLIAVSERNLAKRVCGHCPARTPCLHAALERSEPAGVWGGLDPNERRTLTVLPAREPTPAEEVASGPPHEQAKTA
ncbi:WhiB family transcriptional regulator [Streptomyces sp. NPDC096538]|uniref:WhiB family transcriptional regulator n=1 Tax=Streptomyces sp. NPDC096538 TaxID=3155427 RepID=UPI00332F7B94